MTYEMVEAGYNALKRWLDHYPTWPDSRDPEFQKILSPRMITPQNYERAAVCLVCYAENRSGLYRGMISVAHVFRNRALEDWYDGNIYTNATQQGMTVVLPPEDDEEFKKLIKHIDELYDGRLIDFTFGATGYQTSSHPDRTAVIGTITFYAQEKPEQLPDAKVRDN